MAWLASASCFSLFFCVDLFYISSQHYIERPCKTVFYLTNRSCLETAWLSTIFCSILERVV